MSESNDSTIETGIRPAGSYNLKSFKLYTFEADGSLSDEVDIRNLVYSWTLNESIGSGHISGMVRVLDANGVIYNKPLRGQEFGLVTYTDFHGVERTERLFIYAVTDVEPGSEQVDDSLIYNLQFVSWGKFWSDRYSVSRCIAQGTGKGRKYIPISDQVQVLFGDYYKLENEETGTQIGTSKEIEISFSDGDSKIVIPNMSPEGAMHLMSRRAYSSDYPSNYFRFFESREKYKFINIEELVTNSKSKGTFIYASNPVSIGGDAEVRKMGEIISLSYGTIVDTFQSMGKGAYYRKLNELDLNNRTVRSHDYKHHEEFQEYSYPDDVDKPKPEHELAHSNEFIDTHLNNWHDVWVTKDYPDAGFDNADGLRPKTYYGDIYNNKVTSVFHYNESRTSISIYGSNKIFAGDIITIDVPQFRAGTADKDYKRSGKYIVESIVNVFKENTYTQQLTLVKGPLLKKDNS